MIVVLGRPAAAFVDGQVVPTGMAAAVATAAAGEGASVELVGTIGDDDVGDRLAVALGRRGVGHAALLRISGAATPVGDGNASPPRLDVSDVDLGLRYLTTVGVIVASEPFPADVASVVVDAAAYHGAPIVAITDAGTAVEGPVAETATVLEAPATEVEPFARLVARYAMELDAGCEPGEAYRRARAATGWERRA